MPDFVIVGGGVYGCGVAWHLARQGAEVLLLEAKTIASGASGGLGKRGVRANGRDARELPLMQMAYDIWPTLHQELDGFTGYERSGHLLLFEREPELRTASARAWLQNQKGIPSRLVAQDELREMEPYVSEAILAALYCPLDGVADHTATTRSYAQAARQLGAEIREGTAVSSLERRGERVTAVRTTTDERIPVNHTLLLLSNLHVPQIVQAELGVTLPIWWRLPQVMLTEAIDPMPLRHLIGHASRTLAMKSNPGGEIMISGGWRGQWNPDTNRGETQPDQVAGNLAEAVAVYPCLAGVGVKEASADRWETETVDNIPIIDRLPGAANMLVGTGWSGHGWAIAPAITQLLAAWAMSGNVPELLRPFAYGRFL
ncbi:MAG: FAD-binding oxidoreductase [Ardenticatenaceae bacterium]|nr:FAD-binding oxidoreductase [Ardenticatenaceae bacterium]